MNNMNKIIEFNNVSFKYNSHYVLKDINFNLNKGVFFGIVGPNGAGKTTLLKLIAGLLEPDEGEIIKNTNNIGYVPQIKNVNWKTPISVLDAVEMGRYKWKKKLKKEDKEKSLKYLDIVGLLDLKNRQISELSGGQKQKVFLARAMVNEPEILILDEPNTGIDVSSTDKFYELLMNIKNKNTAIVLVTHQVEVVPKISDMIGCLNVKLYLHDKPEEMFKCPVFEEGYGTEMEMLIHGKSIPHRVVKRKNTDND